MVDLLLFDTCMYRLHVCFLRIKLAQTYFKKNTNSFISRRFAVKIVSKEVNDMFLNIGFWKNHLIVYSYELCWMNRFACVTNRELHQSIRMQIINRYFVCSISCILLCFSISNNRVSLPFIDQWYAWTALIETRLFKMVSLSKTKPKNEFVVLINLNFGGGTVVFYNTRKVAQKHFRLIALQTFFSEFELCRTI